MYMVKLLKSRFRFTNWLVICLLYSLVIAMAAPLAGAANESGSNDREIVSGSGSWVSSFYDEDIPAAGTTCPSVRATAQAGEIKTVYSLEELGTAIKENLYDRNTQFTIRYVNDTSNLKENLDNLLKNVFENDDYLHFSMQSYGYSYKGYVGDVNIEFNLVYLTNREQEEYTASEVKRILGDVLSPGMNNYAKEKAIHDYIVTNVAYDESFAEHSAYAALAKGKTVCQGYALLAYKMLNEAGVGVRIISGDARGESHAWNLVNLYGNWTHLDCTWDDPVPDVKGRLLYNYYNLTDSQIGSDHSWEHSKYPAAVVVYDERLVDEYKEASEYKLFTTREEAPGKMWTVHFNSPVDPETVKSQNIYVRDSYWNMTGTRLETANNNYSVLVYPPVGGYISGGNVFYNLCLENGLRSASGAQLQQAVQMRFNVS